MKKRLQLSFQAKLLLSFILVTALSVGVSHFFISQAVDQAFSDFTVSNIDVQEQLYAQALGVFIEHLSNPENLPGKEGFIEAYTTNALGERTPADNLQEHLKSFMWDMDVTTIKLTPQTDGSERQEEVHLVGAHKLTFDDESLAEDGVLISRVAEQINPLGEEFLDLVDNSLWLAGGTMGGIALLLGFGLLRQLTGPLRNLDSSARQITQGNLKQRVPIRGRDELGRLGASFNEMAASLEQSEDVKRQMIADVAHELRTPLSVVRSGLEGLMDDVLEPTPENFAALHTKTLLVSRLVDDLQELALADAGKLSIRTEAIELKQLLDHIQTTIEVQFEEQNIELLIDLPNTLPPLHADFQRLEQVFLNLLSNATRYTAKGGHIRIHAFQAEDPKFVQVSVCDTGTGFSQADLDHLFDRFYRADKSRSRQSGGSGLGLAIVKALIDAHGGKIWAENSREGGACFHFTLPKC